MPLTNKKIDINYDRSRITPGILHFGVGQFCRAHLFWYTNQLLELSAKEGHKYDNWGIVGVNVLAAPRSAEMARIFKAQQCYYTLSAFPPQGAVTHELIGSMIDYVYAPEEHLAVMRYLVDPEIKIVSLTVTEGGYNINEVRHCFDVNLEEVKADLSHPEVPAATFGYIVEGLRLRRNKGIAPFTVMSCDNLRHNGDVAKMAVLGYANAYNTDLAKWIEQNVQFPNSMVDRITPTTPPAVRDKVNAATGVNDQVPVVCEDFSQWVMEDKFNNARPPWEKVGLELTDNVAPYESTKVRILNSSHLMLSLPGILMGYHTVLDAINDPDIFTLVRNSLFSDVLPTLESPMDKAKYADKVLSRFKNRAVVDQLARIVGDSCSKVQVFWTSTIRALIEGKRDTSNFAFGVAAFIEYLKGKDCNGKAYEVKEPKLMRGWDKLVQSEDPAAALELNAFDPWRNLDHEAFDKDVLKYRKLIAEKGVHEAMPFKQAGAKL